jgi:ribosome biogenesis GTPase A
MNILFKYSRKFLEKKAKDFISVAVVGFTNTGKSSLINVLKNKIVVPTGSSPFLTKTMKEVKLSNTVILIDSPGIMVQGIVNEGNNGERMRVIYSAL